MMSVPKAADDPDGAGSPASLQREAWFTMLYSELRGCIYHASLMMVGGDRSEAEEVMAEAFIRAFKAWEHVVAHPQPRAWLLHAARNIWIDRHRARTCRGEHRHVPLEQVMPEIDAQIPRELGLPLDPALATAINKRLSLQQREVVACRVLAGLSVQATAEVIGTTTGTVRTQLHDALRRLRDELSDYVEEAP